MKHNLLAVLVAGVGVVGLAVIAGILAAFTPRAAFSQDDVDPARIVNLMQGKWLITECVLYGKPSSHETNREVTIDGDQWIAPGSAPYKFEITVDSSPMQIDLIRDERPEVRGRSNGNTAVWGIIYVEKETLKFCANWGHYAAKPNRPKSFDDKTAISITAKRIAQPKVKAAR